MRKSWCYTFIFFGLIPFLVLGESIQQVRSTARNDLKSAITQLSDLRKKIEDEKIPLAREVSQKERDAAGKRKELERRLRLRDNRDANLLQLKQEVDEAEQEIGTTLDLLKNYTRSWRNSTPPAEQEIWGEAVAELISRGQNAPTNSMDAYLSILRLTIKAVQEQTAGLAFSGNAIVPPEGTREEGIFWSLGPILFFSGEKGSNGFLEKSFSSEEFSVVDLTPDSVTQYEPSRLLAASNENAKIITSALKTEPGKLAIVPMDPSMGKAFVMEGGELSIQEELQKGGIWIYPIVFFAALSLVIAIIKAFQILSVSTPLQPASLNGSFSGPFETLRKTAESYQGKKPEILEEIMYEVIIDFQVKLEKALPLIAVTAASAPLLGLLGTVTGMIDVFRQITNFANPENSELARGISEALVTTKFGLVTAIPALITHALLSRRLQGTISKLEGFAARLVHLKKEEPNREFDKSIDNESAG